MKLFRPVGPKELELLKACGFKSFPPRLPEQPIFYPVLNIEYARKIAADWNVKHSGSGFVTQFEIDDEYAARFPVQTAGASIHKELWIPAEELEEFNTHIIGEIAIVEEYNNNMT